MKHTLALLLSVALYSVFAQSYPVGIQTLSYTDAARSNRAVGVEFRYPGNNSAVASGQFPFVIFAHGFQMDAVPYYPYADTLATHGYIVGLLTTETALLPNHADFAQDLIFVYQKLISESNSNSASPFYQHVIAKGAIGGHSMGGGSTVLSAQYGNPAECYFTFAAANTNPSSIAAAPAMTKPYLSFAGSRDCIAPIATHQQPMYDSSGSPCKFLINITDALHCQFGSGNFQCNLGEGLSFCASSPLSRGAQIAKTLFYLLPFLDYYLKGDCTAWTLFESRYSSNTTDALQRNCTNIVPANAAISGSLFFCQGSSTVLRANLAGFNYLWSDNSTSDTLQVNAAGNYSLVVANEVCSISAQPVSVAENPLPVIGNIKGDDSICSQQLSSVFYLISKLYADTVIWQTTSSLSIVAGASTDSISVQHNGTGGVIYVTGSNACGFSATDSLQFVVLDTPIVTIVVQQDTLKASATNGNYQWYFEGSLLPGETDSFLVVNQTGSYSIVVTDANGCSASAVVNVVYEDVKEEAVTSQLTISPNPLSSGNWQLKTTEEMAGKEVKLYDSAGRNITSLRITNSVMEMDASRMTQGVYIVKLGEAVIRLIKL